jgi:hypothetical protein
MVWTAKPIKDQSKSRIVVYFEKKYGFDRMYKTTRRREMDPNFKCLALARHIRY